MFHLSILSALRLAIAMHLDAPIVHTNTLDSIHLETKQNYPLSPLHGFDNDTGVALEDGRARHNHVGARPGR